MGFWFFMLAMNLLIPVIMLGFGVYFKNHAPSEINAVFGYRTAMSMKNKDTWEFAHHQCGRLWWKIGLIMFPVSAIAMLFIMGKSESVVGAFGAAICCLQVILLVASIVPIERALKLNFDQQGHRR